MAKPGATVGILGAGTMGAGIAQVAATGGWVVELMDVDEPTVRQAVAGIRKRLDRLVEKGRVTPTQRDAAVERLRVAGSPRCFSAADMLIEAVSEDFDTKVAVLKANIGDLPDDAVIATNTSSLSITRLGAALGEPGRTVGTHFFNPAPVLELVEIIKGDATDDDVVERATRIVTSWGKTPVRAKDTPGFIVNRVARPYYLESWRILEDGYAGVDEIDGAIHALSGFRLGPFELTDLIGQDVNTATSRSVWEQLGKLARFTPSPVQEKLVAEGALGRKTGRGAYRYDADPPVPAVEIDRRPLELADDLRQAIDDFVTNATRESGSGLQRYVFARILAAIINEAFWTVHDGVATEADIDTAMKLGTNYPMGPCEWAARIGHDRCAALLGALSRTVADDRYEAGGPLRTQLKTT